MARRKSVQHFPYSIVSTANTDQVDFGDLPAFDLDSNTMAIEVWFKQNIIGASEEDIISRYKQGGGSANQTWVLRAGDAYTVYVKDDVGGLGDFQTGVVPKIGQQEHVVFSLDGTNAKLWVDGVEVYTTPYTATPNPSPDCKVTIGARDSGADGLIDSDLSRARVWKTGMTQAKVDTLYYEGVDPDPDNRILEAKMIDGVGSTVTESAGNDGTITGFTWDGIDTPDKRRKSVQNFDYSLASPTIDSPLTLSETFDPSTSDWSLILPVKVSEFATERGAVVIFYSQGGGDTWLAMSTDSNKLRTSFGAGAAFDVDFSITDKDWHTLGQRYNATTQDLDWFFDGVLVVRTASIVITSETGVHKITTNSSGGFGLKGNIARPMFYDRLLTNDEYEDNYYDGVIPTTNQLYDFPLTEGSGNPADISGNGVTATLGSNTWNATDTPEKARSVITQARTSIS